MSEIDAFDPADDPRYRFSGRHARPDPIIQAIESAQPGREYAIGDYLPEMDLPGFGEEYEDCGDDLAHFCEDCGHTVIFGRTCSRSQCPRCAMSWVLKAASGRGRDSPGIVPRLEALFKLKFATNPEGMEPKRHHLVISPPKDWTCAAEDPFERGQQVVKEIMDELRIEGLTAYHPYRGKEEFDPQNPDPDPEPMETSGIPRPRAGPARTFDDEAWPYGPDEREVVEPVDEVLDEDDDAAVARRWKHRLGSEREWEDVREELEWSPHWHVVGISDFVRGKGVVERVEAETGWVIHRIQSKADPRISLKTLDAKARAVTYCLSHTGLYETPSGQKRAAYRMVGSDLNGIEVFEKTDRKARLAVRKAAPRVLGIPAPRLACDALVAHYDLDDYEEEEVEAVDEVVAEAQRALVARSGGGGGPAPPPGSSSGDAAGLPTPAGVDDLSPRTVEACNGAFLSIGAAPSMLDDEEWCRLAVHVDELRAAYEEWREVEDWID